MKDKVFIIMGKSSTGKDTIFREIMKRNNIGLKRLVPYTTRPKREGEEDGKQYFFVTAEERDEMAREGKILEIRNYQTALGEWSYFTARDMNWEDRNPHLMIGTLDTFEKLKINCIDREIIPIYIEVEDGERLERSLTRERKEKNPKYVEMCRRFIADEMDFSEEKLNAAGIEKRFYNDDLQKTVDEILDFIEENI